MHILIICKITYKYRTLLRWCSHSVYCGNGVIFCNSIRRNLGIYKSAGYECIQMNCKSLIMILATCFVVLLASTAHGQGTARPAAFPCSCDALSAAIQPSPIEPLEKVCILFIFLNYVMCIIYCYILLYNIVQPLWGKNVAILVLFRIRIFCIKSMCFYYLHILKFT
jgi:hypothetical protein